VTTGRVAPTLGTRSQCVQIAVGARKAFNGQRGLLRRLPRSVKGEGRVDGGIALDHSVTVSWFDDIMSRTGRYAAEQ
jgi:hypothetical protein